MFYACVARSNMTRNLQNILGSKQALVAQRGDNEESAFAVSHHCPQGHVHDGNHGYENERLINLHQPLRDEVITYIQNHTESQQYI